MQKINLLNAIFLVLLAGYSQAANLYPEDVLDILVERGWTELSFARDGHYSNDPLVKGRYQVIGGGRQFSFSLNEKNEIQFRSFQLEKAGAGEVTAPTNGFKYTYFYNPGEILSSDGRSTAVRPYNEGWTKSETTWKNSKYANYGHAVAVDEQGENLKLYAFRHTRLNNEEAVERDGQRYDRSVIRYHTEFSLNLNSNGKVLFATIVPKSDGTFSIFSIEERENDRTYEVEYIIEAKDSRWIPKIIGKNEVEVKFKRSSLKVAWPSAKSKKAAMCRRFYRH